ncbi:putative late blight resistance protein R1B-12 [Salvia divinorum]|uniref:Late blight resistance protein R1B-12 n=1 Tax=Salvia divinorum TaxID=28513 RepID=A0ABD1GEI6_SALDI
MLDRPASLYGPNSLYENEHFVEIEMEDCNPLALACATKLQPRGFTRLLVTAASSFYEKPTTFRCNRYGGNFAAAEQSSDSDHDRTSTPTASDVSNAHSSTTGTGERGSSAVEGDPTIKSPAGNSKEKTRPRRKITRPARYKYSSSR